MDIAMDNEEEGHKVDSTFDLFVQFVRCSFTACQRQPIYRKNYSSFRDIANQSNNPTPLHNNTNV